ncbi:P-loop containing nucleoside triphosphate hydrolase protein [Kalaharituber pfeilii]|nr:P-loop containing nucleoside triphosphate hydrolase protein [Kalaharituber pfeilii]
MPRQRAPSVASTMSSKSGAEDQELGSMYDYLAKIVLLGPSGCGKSCLLHRFVRGEWKILTSQTIGVEFSSKIVRVGTGPRSKRIKLQLWDTAGQERFRSVTRSYYRGATGALLIYDVARYETFAGLSTFLADARALASAGLTVVLVGNKSDLTDTDGDTDTASIASTITPQTYTAHGHPNHAPSAATGNGQSANQPDHSPRHVTPEESHRFASAFGIPYSIETSALTGENVDEAFVRLARMILTKIELGEVDPDDPSSGIQYGDFGMGFGDSAEDAGAEVGVAEEGTGGVRSWSRGGGMMGEGGGRGMLLDVIGGLSGRRLCGEMKMFRFFVFINPNLFFCFLFFLYFFCLCIFYPFPRP